MQYENLVNYFIIRKRLVDSDVEYYLYQLRLMFESNCYGELMRKICMLLLGVVICCLLTVNISFGNNNSASRPSPVSGYFCTMEIMLHVVNTQRIGQWSEPVVEMLLINSERKKTGSDLKKQYKEIPFSKYEPGYDDNSNVFYYIVTGVEIGEVYQLQVFSKHSVSYSLGLNISDCKGDRKSKTEEFNNIKIKKGEVHNYTIKFSNTAPMEIKRVN